MNQVIRLSEIMAKAEFEPEVRKCVEPRCPAGARHGTSCEWRRRSFCRCCTDRREGAVNIAPSRSRRSALISELERIYAHRGVNLVKSRGKVAVQDRSRSGFPAAQGTAGTETSVTRRHGDIGHHRLSPAGDAGRNRDIRGVMLSKGTLDALMEVGWVKKSAAANARREGR